MLLRHRRPARHDHAARPGGAARHRHRGHHALPRCGARPAEGRALPPVAGPGPPRAGLPAGVHGVHRRARPDDPVQGEGSWQRLHPRLAVHLPGPDGGGHPALPAHAGAGRRRPAAARRADPRPGDEVQPPVRRGVHRPRDRHPRGRGPGDGPAGPDAQDEQVRGAGRGRWGDPAARPAGRGPPQDRAGGDGLRHRPGRRTRRCGQTRRRQPPRHPHGLRRLCNRPEHLRRAEGGGHRRRGRRAGTAAEAVRRPGRRPRPRRRRVRGRLGPLPRGHRPRARRRRGRSGPPVRGGCAATVTRPRKRSAASHRSRAGAERPPRPTPLRAEAASGLGPRWSRRLRSNRHETPQAVSASHQVS